MKKIHIFLLAPFLSMAQNVSLKNPDQLFPIIHFEAQSPVKYQGNRNTCTAFAIAAALETFPNAPKDLSEKYLYAVQKSNDYVNSQPTFKGDFLFRYVDALKSFGAIKETDLPYNPQATLQWYPNDDELTRYILEGDVGYITLNTIYKPKAVVFLRDYEYLEGMKSKNIAYLKTMLNSGIKAIPVSYMLYLPAWSNERTLNYTTITPDKGYDVVSFTGTKMPFSQAKALMPNVISQIFKENIKINQNDPTPNMYGKHAVTIIGYDNEGFIIKNSWGNQWRFNGYERVSFDYHELFAIEALIIKSVSNTPTK
ncbi:C1 family peptidase [Flavobacterium sp.]|uniref:C1 family peptidase n=1 Tax=Flavobacterium sp. TaxID=239 RepID=UPI003D145703